MKPRQRGGKHLRDWPMSYFTSTAGSEVPTFQFTLVFTGGAVIAEEMSQVLCSTRNYWHTQYSSKSTLSASELGLEYVLKKGGNIF